MKSLITFLVFATCLNNGVRLQVAPSVSPGVLLDLFIDIENTLGVFPDRPDNSSLLYIVTQDGNNCMNIDGGFSGSGVPVITWQCGSTGPPNDRFRLHHIGDGYITFASSFASCIGAGYTEGADVVTGDWCDSVSHQFALTREDDHALFVNRETGYCLLGYPLWGYSLYVGPCDGNPEARWLLCKDPDKTLCWPSSQVNSPIKKPINLARTQILRNEP